MEKWTLGDKITTTILCIFVSIVLGVFTALVLNSFATGFFIIPVLVIILKLYNKKQDKKHIQAEEERIWRTQEKLDRNRRIQYCKCGAKVRPIYVAGIWVYNCHKCKRSWRLRW